jgi:leader peptidase (prepilin peptidase)/N-methyltransferase
VDSIADFLTANPVAFVALGAFVGLVVGSFLNVVIHRLPKILERQWRAECAELQGVPSPDLPRYNLVSPRSACPRCEHT